LLLTTVFTCLFFLLPCARVKNVNPRLTGHELSDPIRSRIEFAEKRDPCANTCLPSTEKNRQAEIFF